MLLKYVNIYAMVCSVPLPLNCVYSYIFKVVIGYHFSDFVFLMLSHHVNCGNPFVQKCIADNVL
jgi:hypothetical protein